MNLSSANIRAEANQKRKNEKEKSGCMWTEADVCFVHVRRRDSGVGGEGDGGILEWVYF